MKTKNSTIQPGRSLVTGAGVLWVVVMAVCIVPYASAQQATADGRSFRFFDGWGLAGGDYLKSRPGQISFEQCEATCRVSEKCTAFSYRADEGICYLKNRITEFKLQKAVRTGILSSLSPPPPPPCSEQAYETIADNNTIVNYLAFLKKCKKGPLARKARQALKELVGKKEKIAWDDARRANTKPAYQDFLRKYPESRQAAGARSALQRIWRNEHRESAWKVAVNENSCRSYRDYLKNFPSISGPYFERASRLKKEKCYPDLPPVIKPGFNCKFARKDSEKAICQTPILAALDVKMTQLYKAVKSQQTRESARELLRLQVQWLRNRNACGDDRFCLESRYIEQINVLSGYLYN